jgi:hypothetical protein
VSNEILDATEAAATHGIPTSVRDAIAAQPGNRADPAMAEATAPTMSVRPGTVIG